MGFFDQLQYLKDEFGRPLFFGMDTGAQYTHFGEALKTKCHDLIIKKKMLHAGGVGGFKEVEGEVLEHLSVLLNEQPLEFKNIRKVLVEYAAFFKLDGVLGSDGCQGGLLKIDYPNRKLELFN